MVTIAERESMLLEAAARKLSAGFNDLACHMVRLNDFAGAVHNFGRAIDMDPDNFAARFSLVSLFLQQDDLVQAVHALQGAECFDVNNVFLHEIEDTWFHIVQFAKDRSSEDLLIEQGVDVEFYGNEENTFMHVVKVSPAPSMH